MTKAEKLEILGTVKCTVPVFQGKNGPQDQVVKKIGQSTWGRNSRIEVRVSQMYENPVLTLKQHPWLAARQIEASKEALNIIEEHSFDELAKLLKTKKDGKTDSKKA